MRSTAYNAGANSATQLTYHKSMSKHERIDMSHVTLTLPSDGPVIMEATQQKNPSSINIRLIDTEQNRLVDSRCYNVSDVVEFAYLIIKQYGESS